MGTRITLTASDGFKLQKELFADTGLSPEAAARAAYLLIVYVFGSLALETADVHEPGPLPPETTRIATRRRALSATPTDGYPRAAAATDTMATYVTTEQYRWGLSRLLDGITIMVLATARRSAGWRCRPRRSTPVPW